MSDEASHDDVRKIWRNCTGERWLIRQKTRLLFSAYFFPSLNNDVLNYLDERTLQTFEIAVHSDRNPTGTTVFRMKNWNVSDSSGFREGLTRRWAYSHSFIASVRSQTISYEVSLTLLLIQDNLYESSTFSILSKIIYRYAIGEDRCLIGSRGHDPWPIPRSFGTPRSSKRNLFPNYDCFFSFFFSYFFLLNNVIRWFRVDTC